MNAAIDDSRERESYRSSYHKTTAAAVAAALLCLVPAALLLYFDSSRFATEVAWLLSLLCFLCTAVACSGLVVLYRDRREAEGRTEFFLHLLNRPLARHQGGLGRLRRLTRTLLGSALRPGDLVRVRSAKQILETLDSAGMLDDLPFMPEMLDQCGRIFRVHRRIDKINDMIQRTGLRRMRGVVMLQTLPGDGSGEDLRCDGTAHDGCQAECQILWKEVWLERCSATPRQSESGSGDDGTRSAAHSDPARQLLEGRVIEPARCATGSGGREACRYMCQITQLRRASEPMAIWDIRQDLRPLFNGNVSLSAFLVAMLTRLFNRVQKLRGGGGYPVMPEQLRGGGTPTQSLNLRAGERVIIKNKREIARTLIKNHNRGLWFGRELLRFCGSETRVRRVVEEIINERTGEMLVMKTPCIVLSNVTATGEFLRFCPQNEYVWFHEIWLERSKS